MVHTYHMGDQGRLRRACASALSLQSLRCSHTWSLEVDWGSHWIAAHARLKNEFLLRTKSTIISWHGSNDDGLEFFLSSGTSFITLGPTWKPVKHPPAILGSCMMNITWNGNRMFSRIFWYSSMTQYLAHAASGPLMLPLSHCTINSVVSVSVFWRWLLEKYGK